jgi:hypothetical protein
LGDEALHFLLLGQLHGIAGDEDLVAQVAEGKVADDVGGLGGLRGLVGQCGEGGPIQLRSQAAKALRNGRDQCEIQLQMP